MIGWLGVPEIIVILVIALIIFGPKKLPEIGKTVGKTMANIKKTTDGIIADLQQEIDADDIKKTIEQLKVDNPLDDLNKKNDR
jgi:Tat protein translocase TatB subunit